MAPIGVGLIGASAINPGWATAVHIPAIAASSDVVLRAVSTSSSASASASAAKFGVPAFDNVDALLERADIDLVVVAVKVPHHRALITQAIAAVKPVFSEWPLAASVQEAEDLAASASGAGVYTAIGLQARFSPAIEAARRLVQNGNIGDVLATSLVGSGMAWGDTADSAHAYMFEAGSGASVLSVPLMHALDALIYVLGGFKRLEASTAIRRPMVTLTDRPETIVNSSPDHVAISGILTSGAVAAVLFRGGTSRAGNLRWEINGTAGDLLLTGANGNIQVAELELRSGRGKATDLDVHPTDSNVNAAIGNVARLYQAIAQDLRHGDRSAPDFSLALDRHHLLAEIERAASAL
jgi:predicted dehydrogenase